MSFPQVSDADTRTGSQTANTQSHRVNLPSNVRRDDLVLVFISFDGSPTVTWPPGWTPVVAASNGVNNRLEIRFRIADGTEGASLTATTNVAEQSVHRSIRVSGVDPATPPVGVTASGANATPDAPLLDPAPWAREDTLWFAIAANDDGMAMMSAGPVNYTTFVNQTSGGAAGCGLGTARREGFVAAEDPGAFTLSAARAWVAATVAVRPTPRRNFAFATSGRSRYEVALRRMLMNRRETTLVQEPGVVTVEQFIDHLETGGSVTRPVDDLVIGSHGTDHGWLEIDLDVEPPGVANFARTNPDEVIAADASDSIEVPAVLTRPGATFYIRGCKVGQDAGFMELFHAALGGRLPVNAPRFFHHVHSDRLGAYEFFLYDYQIIRPWDSRFANRAAALAGFAAGGFNAIDNNPVPADSWRHWIPRNFRARRKQRIPIRVSLGQFPGLPPTIDIERVYEYEIETFPELPIHVPGAIPGSDDARRQILRDELRNRPEFQEGPGGVPYPDHRRYDRLGPVDTGRNSCTSTDDLIDNFDTGWDLRPRAQHLLVARARRHKYVVGPPVVHPASGNAVFNFYPHPGSGVDPVRQVADSDPTFFVTVP